MYILKYKNVKDFSKDKIDKKSKQHYKTAQKLSKNLVCNLVNKYRNNASDLEISIIEGALKIQILNLVPLVNQEFEGKNILDIGCGSINSSDNIQSSYGIVYEPWLCRALLELNANPIGLDIADNSTEKFRCFQIDLTREFSFNFLDEIKIDIIHSRFLYDSPLLEKSSNYNVQKFKSDFIKKLNERFKSDIPYIYYM